MKALKVFEFIKIAFRNLGRHKIKTLITCSAIAIGITSYIFMDAMIAGMDIGARRNIVNFQSGAAKVYSKEYYAEKDYKPLYEGFTGYQSILDKLDSEGFHGAPVVSFHGTLIHKDLEQPFSFSAIEPESYEQVFRLNEYIVPPGKMEADTFSIVLGISGAKKLKAKIGDIVKLYTVIKTKDEQGKIRNEFQVILLRVSGLLKSPNLMVNGNYGYLPMAMLQDEMGLRLEGRVTEVVIRKKNAPRHNLPGKAEAPDKIRAALDGVLADHLTVVGWVEDNQDFINYLKTESKFSTILIAVLVIIVIIGVSNTMLMAVLERTKEIGMMGALGMTNGEVIVLYMIEAGMIGFIGSVLGVILGTILNIPLVLYGWDLSGFMEGADYDEKFNLVAHIYSVWNIRAVIFSIVFMTLVSSITSLFPAFRAVKLNIVDALRFE